MTSDPGGAQNPFETSTFAGRPGGIADFAEAVLALLPSRPGQRVLDLGCGAGDLALALQRGRPDLDVTGVDVSPENVARASARSEAHPGSRRPTFVKADYLAFAGGGFDAILADSVLHLIACGDDELFVKLASDLLPGGLLVATLPVRSFGNAVLTLQRRVWRKLPRALDGAALRLATLMHPGEAPCVLADRVAYLRLLPNRLLDEDMTSGLARQGLRPVSTAAWPSPSLFKPRHRLAVYCRSDALQ